MRNHRYYTKKEIGIQTFMKMIPEQWRMASFNGDSKDARVNVLFINMDYGIGFGIWLYLSLYYGKSGFMENLTYPNI
jgi:predicted NBD/HSP70 family sugar kinase